jgi:hypothetical protein
VQIEVSFTVELSASADVNEAEAKVSEAGRAAMLRALGLVCREYEAQVDTCPACGGGELEGEGTDRRVLLTGFGRAVLHLRRLRCGGCGGRFRPATRFIECLGGANITDKLRDACVLAGASWPYQTAARVLRELCGARVSHETLRRITVEAGTTEAGRQVREAEVAHSPTARRARARAPQPGKPAPELMLVGLDGGWVPGRDQPGGMEGKVGVVATRVETVSRSGRRRLTRRKLVATFGSGAQLGLLACTECIRLGGHDARRQAVLGDAAGWIRAQAAQHFGGATKILDWPHVWRAVTRAVRAARPGGRHKQERKGLYEALREPLWHGRVDEAVGVLAGLRGAERVQALEEAIQYLSNQRDWLGDYEAWRREGYPVGSGLVERQVELAINRRLKRRGMRWLRANADALLALRVQQLNQDWDERTLIPAA